MASPRLVVLAALAAGLLAPPSAAQSSGGPSALGALPDGVSFVVRIDAGALAGSPMLARLLETPEASNPLARALAEPSILRRLQTLYVGFPATFRPSVTEIPVILTGSFAASEMTDLLAGAPGVKRTREDGRELLAADDGVGTSYAASLGDGVLAVGDRSSVLAMLDRGAFGGRGGELAAGLGPEDGALHVVGAGRVPVALRGWLQAEGGPLAAPFAAVERLSFEGTLDEAMRVRATLHPTTAEARQGIEQALGALQVFGPSRFANDPEVLSAIQSLRFSSGPKRVDVSATLPRSLLLRLLAP